MQVDVELNSSKLFAGEVVQLNVANSIQDFMLFSGRLKGDQKVITFIGSLRIEEYEGAIEFWYQGAHEAFIAINKGTNEIILNPIGHWVSIIETNNIYKAIEFAYSVARIDYRNKFGVGR